MNLLESFAISSLLTISSALGVSPVPKETGPWRVTRPWHEIHSADTDGPPVMLFEAESREIARLCVSQPDSYLVFPPIIHGSQVVKVDGKITLSYGDPTFRTVHSFYGQPVLSCREIAGAELVQWEAYSYTKYFSRVGYFPKIQASRPFYNVLAETLNVIGAGAGLIMAILIFTIFSGKANQGTTFAVGLSSLFSSFYLAGCVAGFFGLPWSMLTTHKIADVSVWVSICSFVKALSNEGLVTKFIFRVFLATIILAITLILIGGNGDFVQFGTTLPFGLTLISLSFPVVRLSGTVLTQKSNRLIVLQLLALSSFVAAAFNEMFVVTGLTHSSPMLPFGFMGGVMFLALSVNERVNETYRERDYLRANLELEVKRALHDLKTTQAELVQSAKLASLGTLSAGIAHEINNSLNYVNGALQPLEKLIEKSAVPQDREKINKLLAVMKDGLNLTLEIIKGLRTYTGLNQAKFNDVNIANVVNSSLTILRNRIRGRITVTTDIPQELNVYGAVVGLNQIFMNLISNAVDAMADNGTLTVSARAENDGHVHLIIRDSGSGIPREIQDRIFEPFFTTKEVGSGTGLGLYIVKQEIDRHKGQIRVESEAGRGTAFHIRLPMNQINPGETDVRETA